MITQTQLNQVKSILDSAYKDKDFSDHNFPTPYEIVKFVESISNAKEVIVERNIEWLLDNKVSKFISECDDKQKMLNLLKNKLSLNTSGMKSRDLNISKMQGTMDLTKLKLRTNYPFNGDTGNLKSNIWPELLRRDWDRGYSGIECIIGSAWALADTSNTGSTNKDAREFILPKLNWFIWNDLSLFQPHATVQTCTIDISTNNGNTFEVYDSNFNIIYVGDKNTDKYIFKTKLVRDLVQAQQLVFGNNYMSSPYSFVRNQFPTETNTTYEAFSVNKDGNPVKNHMTTKVDRHTSVWRLQIPDTRNSTQGDPWFKTIAKVKPNIQTVKKNNTYFAASTEFEIDSLKSLLQTKTVCILFEDNMYSRTFTAPTAKFIAQYPLDRIWTDDAVLKYINAEHLLSEIEDRYSRGFNV
jgi:hypothetical protein|tara:strand:- start:1010 stop:2242 length:1233 start_codon:yes stop_codon:yes gene_type:complete